MQRELIALLSRVHVPAAPAGAEPQATRQLVTAFNAEVAGFGYALDGGVVDALLALPDAELLAVRADILAALGALTGANANHAVLFDGFPYRVPNQWQYLLRRVYGFMQNSFGLPVRDARVLSCGHVVDGRLFALEEFGACPICQFQVPELASVEEIRHEFARTTPLRPLALADAGFLAGRAGEMLARQGSLSADERGLLAGLVGQVVPGRPATVFRETLPLVYAFFGEDADYIQGLLASATDVLRISAWLSDPEADLSLAAPVRFRLRTSHKRRLLGLMDGLDNLAEDMMRHREMWLRWGEVVNPGTARNRARFPHVAEVFDYLRNAPHGIVTFNRKVEAGIRGRSLGPTLLATLEARPGEFLRRLDLLLRRAEDAGPVLESLCRVVREVPVRRLFEMAKYLDYRQTGSTNRVFVPKGQVNRLQVLPDRRPGIRHDVLGAAAAMMRTELARRLAALGPMGRIYVDPALRDVVMPWNRRGDSSASAAVSKGSRYPMPGGAEVIRLFVHWTGDVDVDLSMTLHGPKMEHLKTIAWHDLAGYGCKHSGDIQNAPDGASEFIDFTPATLVKRGVRYVLSSAIVYRGGRFGSFPCFAGFMGRDGLKSGARYEPSSVALKFDIASGGTAHAPILFDLLTRQVVVADLHLGAKSHRLMESDNAKFVAAAQAMLAMPQSKPTVWDALAANAAARGTLVERRQEADHAFTLRDLDMEAVLALMA